MVTALLAIIAIPSFLPIFTLLRMRMTNAVLRTMDDFYRVAKRRCVNSDVEQLLISGSTLDWILVLTYCDNTTIQHRFNVLESCTSTALYQLAI